MKKAFIFALVLGLVAGMLMGPAQAKKKKKKKVVRIERVVEVPYQCPCGPSWGADTPAGSGAGFWLVGGAVGGGIAATGADDKYVKVEVTDQSGQTVKVDLAQNVDGTDNLAEVPVGTVCGATEEALEVPSPGVQVDMFVYDGFCDDGTTQSIGTSGTIKLTFSNLP